MNVTSMNHVWLEELPEEILIMVASKLPLRSMLRLERTNKTFKLIVQKALNLLRLIHDDELDSGLLRTLSILEPNSTTIGHSVANILFKRCNGQNLRKFDFGRIVNTKLANGHAEEVARQFPLLIELPHWPMNHVLTYTENQMKGCHLKRIVAGQPDEAMTRKLLSNCPRLEELILLPDCSDHLALIEQLLAKKLINLKRLDVTLYQYHLTHQVVAKLVEISRFASKELTINLSIDENDFFHYDHQETEALESLLAMPSLTSISLPVMSSSLNRVLPVVRTKLIRLIVSETPDMEHAKLINEQLINLVYLEVPFRKRIVRQLTASFPPKLSAIKFTCECDFEDQDIGHLSHYLTLIKLIREHGQQITKIHLICRDFLDYSPTKSSKKCAQELVWDTMAKYCPALIKLELYSLAKVSWTLDRRAALLNSLDIVSNIEIAIPQLKRVVLLCTSFSQISLNELKSGRNLNKLQIKRIFS